MNIFRGYQFGRASLSAIAHLIIHSMRQILSTCRLHWARMRMGSIGVSIVVIMSAMGGGSDHVRAQAAPVPPQNWDAKDQCFQQSDPFAEIERGRRGTGALVIENLFLNTGGQVDIGLSRKFEEGKFFFIALLNRDEPSERTIVRPSTISSRAATDADLLVKTGALKTSQTIINATLPDGTADAWQRAYLYVYNCAGSPTDVVRLEVRVSSMWLSTAMTWGAVILVYCLAAFALNRLEFSLNPLHMIAGPDGRASLAKLQVLFFTLVVFSLLTFFLLRTGKLSEISETILILLGIAGAGSAAARGVDSKTSIPTGENRAWLADKATREAVPQWSDLFTTDGEFDVYRYQGFLFSLIVGAALLATGVTQLSSFEIPKTLLGVLGLSQIIYIGGKVAVQSSSPDVNKMIDQAKVAERQLQEAASKPGPGGPLSDAEKFATPEYAAYEATLKQVDAVTRLGLQPKIPGDKS